MTYAFVVMVVLNGAPQYFILERGLTAAQCQEISEQGDNDLLLDGKPVRGEGQCIPEDGLSDLDAPP